MLFEGVVQFDQLAAHETVHPGNAIVVQMDLTQHRLRMHEKCPSAFLTRWSEQQFGFDTGRSNGGGGAVITTLHLAVLVIQVMTTVILHLGVLIIQVVLVLIIQVILVMITVALLSTVILLLLLFAVQVILLLLLVFTFQKGELQCFDATLLFEQIVSWGQTNYHHPNEQEEG